MSGGANGHAPIAAMVAGTEISVGAAGSGSGKETNAAQENPKKALPTSTRNAANATQDNAATFREGLTAIRHAVNADLTREIGALREKLTGVSARLKALKDQIFMLPILGTPQRRDVGKFTGLSYQSR